MEARLVNRITGETITVNKPVFRIGREKGYVDFCIPNAAVSRHHCDLIQRDDGYYLLDLNSKNGTYVNGVKLLPNQEICLRHGDELTIAHMHFVFECIPIVGNWEVFISFKNIDTEGRPTRDREMAESLYEALTAKGIRAFCASRSTGKADAAYDKRTVNNALEHSRILVAVGTSLENLESAFVKSEIDQFRSDMLYGVKAFGTSTILTYRSEELLPNQLPLALRMQQSFTDQDGLVSFIEHFLRKRTGQSGGEVR